MDSLKEGFAMTDKCAQCKLWYEKTCPHADTGTLENCPDFVEKKALEDLRAVFHKWFKYEDETFLDLCLAVRVHTKLLEFMDLTPLWLVCIAPSGDRKSETLRAFYDGGNKTRKMNHITPSTLASGHKKSKKNDLAPKLDKKLVITYDFGQFLKLHEGNKAQIWSQLRSGFDGEVVRDTGSGVSTVYEGLKWNWVIGSTPAIDNELIIRNQLGTRELIYRLPNEEETTQETEELMEKVWNNSQTKEEMRRELNEGIKEYLFWYANQGYRDKFNAEISEEAKKKIFLFTRFITKLRATAEIDSYTGGLTNFVYPEKPTRILEQMKGIFQALKTLSLDYSDKTALDRLRKITKSTIHPVRLAILKKLVESGTLSTSGIQKAVGLGFKTVYSELCVLQQLGLVNYEEEDMTNKYGSVYKTKRIWHAKTDDELIRFITEMQVQTKLSEEDEPKSIPIDRMLKIDKRDD